MFMGFREKLYRFMQGRNGADIFCRYLFGLYIILWIINIFAKSRIISLLEAAVIAYMFFRILSKNRYQRMRECYYVEKLDRWLRSTVSLCKKRISDRSHAYRKCPGCGQIIRLPGKKGTHTVECPKCHKDFKVLILFSGKR